MPRSPGGTCPGRRNSSARGDFGWAPPKTGTTEHTENTERGRKEEAGGVRALLSSPRPRRPFSVSFRVFRGFLSSGGRHARRGAGVHGLQPETGAAEPRAAATE